MPARRGKKWTASGYDKSLGRKKHLGTYPSRKDAVQAEAEWKLRTRPTGQETCDTFALRWTTDYPRPRASTNDHNAERVQRFATDFAGVKLTDIDKPTARRWALTHGAHLGAVRAMFTDAVNDGLCDLNPFAGLRLPGGKGRKELLALTERELIALADTALLEKCELGEFGHHYRAMILFAGYVGLRPGELFALRRDDVQGQLCTIQRALSSTGEIGPTKNGRARTVIVPPAAQDALLTVAPDPSGLLFTSPRGRMWTQSSHHRYWSTVRREANRPGFDFYELRHAAATMLLERGATPWDVAIQLGHTDGGHLVMDLYGHPAEDGARARLLAAYEDVKPLRATNSRRESA